jgi:two-component system, response regulator PdtaR
LSRVLIVEDEALVALELEELLLDEGFEVVGSAAKAAQAIDLGRRHRPDLALLDLNLADGLTGPGIAKTLVHERLATVVFVTGQANLLPSDLHGAFGAIEKPCVGRPMVEALRFLSSYLCVRRRRRLRLPCNRALVDLARHYGFQPRACRPYRPKTKGKVERPFRYIRERRVAEHGR